MPCITLRDETEWVELVEAGVNILAGSCQRQIANSLIKFSPLDFNYSFYGSGNTAKKIIEHLVNY